jgi:hypothetical protein
VGVSQPAIRQLVRASVWLGNHGVHGQVLAVLQRLVTDGAETRWPPRQRPRATGRGAGSAPPRHPVIVERRGIGSLGGRDQPMPSDLGPGERPAGPRTRLILKDPSVLSADGRAPIRLRSPPSRVARGPPFHRALGAFGPATIHVGADRLGHPGAAGVAPAPDHRSPRVDQGPGGRAHLGAPETCALPRNRRARGLARVDPERVATARARGRRRMPEGTPQAMEAVAAVTHRGCRV